jgi:hypothetical protein
MATAVKLNWRLTIQRFDAAGNEESKEEWGDEVTCEGRSDPIRLEAAKLIGVQAKETIEQRIKF